MRSITRPRLPSSASSLTSSPSLTVTDVLPDPEALLVLPNGEQARCAVLVLSGSSGRIEIDRIRLLASHGAAALSLRWFGGPGQPSGICEVPLETFAPALDRLASISDHLCVIGTSKGAEAALLLASRDHRIRAVAGLSPRQWYGPTSDQAARRLPHTVARRGARTVTPCRSSPTTRHGVPPRSAGYRPTGGLYEQSLRTFAQRVPAATIPVEQITADVLLAAGGDDQVWPSEWFAQQIKDRRSAHQLATEVITAADAGHRIPLPGEPSKPPGGMAMARGGIPAADAALGQRVWPALLQLLRLPMAGQSLSHPG
ncbi:MAG: acyl-CoA thioester hydrolase/BAAT C-terminal domain-containing protein [Pseudonocardiaceae bacterium]